MKTVLKWNPYLDFELSAQEAWLEELSQEGLTIRFRLSSLTVCNRGEPRPGRRFRIEPARTWASASDPPARELTELYEAAGWHYLSRLPGERGELFYTDDPSAPEPYTAPETKALALDGLRRQFGRRCMSGALTMLLLLFDHFVAFPMAFLNTRPFSFDLWGLLLVLWYALVLFYLVQEWRELRRTCRRLELGISTPLPPHRKMRALKAAMDALCLAMWIILLALIPLCFCRAAR